MRGHFPRIIFLSTVGIWERLLFDDTKIEMENQQAWFAGGIIPPFTKDPCLQEGGGIPLPIPLPLENSLNC
jgi:hypothetical protein